MRSPLKADALVKVKSVSTELTGEYIAVGTDNVCTVPMVVIRACSLRTFKTRRGPYNIVVIQSDDTASSQEQNSHSRTKDG